MQSETKQCQNCKKDFTIEPEDFAFYEKIKVPAPTWCPECRQRRRYAWRNERILYRRNCDLCGKSAVTIYSPNKPYKVYCPPCWWSDKWSALDYGQDFDFSKPFFPQFQELQLKVPRIALLTKNSVNSEYTNHANNNKNGYLSFNIFDSENILYSSNLWKNANDCCDCAMITEGGTLLYECVDSKNSYNCQFNFFIRDCTDCFYCYDCRNCQNCFLSYNLRNKRYCILNQQYTKEEYQKKVHEWNLGSFTTRQELFQQWQELIKNKAIHRGVEIERCTNSVGNMLFNCKNVQSGFDSYDIENGKYITLCLDTKDTMDSYHFGFNCELVYESHALIHDYDVMFSHLSYDDSHIKYCDSCHNSQNLFSCVGVKSGSYSIFNKQYSKEEYEELKSKIIEHMRKMGEYGEFFPLQLSPFGYNETQGQVYMPLTKEEALARGYKWEDLVPGTFSKETLQPDQIPDDIKDVKNSILKEVLRCIKCNKNYNIVSPELDFYRRENIPIPKLCPDCRYRNRILNLRLPRKLWHGVCKCDKTNHSHQGRCQNEFETSYSPDRPEIVYCESCYNTEVA
jgi:hypothetical protein